MVRCENWNGANLYSVEVSGWDNQQKFFVEKCDLAWDEDSSKQVELSHRLQANALLFVRLLQTEEGEHTGPVVYEAKCVGKTPSGQQQFRLSALTPVIREQEVSVG